MVKLAEHNIKKLSYYQTGGLCAYFYAPNSLDELAEHMKLIAKEGLPYFILGGGSNSLVMDERWDGAVISLSRLNKTKVNEQHIYCEAGVENSVVAKVACESSLDGAAWMYRLPGQIGATVRMNARCYGGEISQIITKIYTVTPSGDRKDHISSPNSKEVFRGYKDTIFMDSGILIGAVELTLQTGDQSSIKKMMTFCEQDREKKEQFLFPSCGCVFKNNYSPEVSVPSGMLLDKSNVRSLPQNKAVISSSHANFVYNKGATSREILTLTLLMREKVWDEFGVWLEYEMEVLGSIPPDLKSRFFEKREPAYQREKLAGLRAIFSKERPPT